MRLLSDLLFMWLTECVAPATGRLLPVKTGDKRHAWLMGLKVDWLHCGEAISRLVYFRQRPRQAGGFVCNEAAAADTHTRE